MILNPVIQGGESGFPVALSTGSTRNLGQTVVYPVACVVVDGVYYGTGYDTVSAKDYVQHKIFNLPKGKEIELVLMIGGSQTTNNNAGLYINGVRKDNRASGTTRFPYVINGPTVIRLTGEPGTPNTRFGRIDVWEERG